MNKDRALVAVRKGYPPVVLACSGEPRCANNTMSAIEWELMHWPMDLDDEFNRSFDGLAVGFYIWEGVIEYQTFGPDDDVEPVINQVTIRLASTYDMGQFNFHYRPTCKCMLAGHITCGSCEEHCTCYSDIEPVVEPTFNTEGQIATIDIVGFKSREPHEQVEG